MVKSAMVDVDTWMFLSSLLFLVGILLVIASAVPVLSERYPKALMHGFLTALVAVALAVVGAFRFS
jgi:hypothetical protein